MSVVIPYRGTLKAYAESKTTDVNGEAEFLFKVPGDVGEVTRLVETGEAWFDTHTDGDCCTEIVIVDIGNIMGYGAGTVLESFLDNEMPSANQKLYFKQDGSMKVNALYGPGELLGGLYLRFKFKKATPVQENVYVNVYWGRAE